MVDFEYKGHYDVNSLRKLISLLRGENGCPWDKVQTHESIRRNLLEEAYEAAEAIDEGSTEHLLEELGDVLMQVVFHADMEEKLGHFDLDDVADGVCKKLILRHPHVFGDVSVQNSDEVLSNWEDIKRAEKKQDTVADSLEAVAKSLPSLWRAEKIQKKAAKVGFDWPDMGGAVDKLHEELSELEEAAKTGSGTKEELVDLLFSAVNAARFLKIDPEEALHEACDKFTLRFSLLEQEAVKRGKKLEDMTLSEMDELYELAKKTLRSSTH